MDKSGHVARSKFDSNPFSATQALAIGAFFPQGRASFHLWISYFLAGTGGGGGTNITCLGRGGGRGRPIGHPSLLDIDAPSFEVGVLFFLITGFSFSQALANIISQMQPWRDVSCWIEMHLFSWIMIAISKNNAHTTKGQTGQARFFGPILFITSSHIWLTHPLKSHHTHMFSGGLSPGMPSR